MNNKHWHLMGFPDGSEGKASACNVGDQGLIPGLGRSPGEGNGNPLQYSCLENPMDGGAWWATVHGVAKSRTRLSDFTFTFFQGFPGGASGKESSCQCRRSKRHGFDSCLENSRDRRALWLQPLGSQSVGHD